MKKNFVVGGEIVHHDIQVYVERPLDRDIFDFITKSGKPGTAVSILGSRQMGKSSLRIKITDQFKDIGWKCVELDLREFEIADSKPVDTFVNMLTEEITKNLNEDLDLSKISNLIPKIGALSKKICSSTQPIIFFVDEIEALAGHKKIAIALCELIQRCINGAGTNNIVWVTAGYLRLTDLVGHKERLAYDNFEEFEVADFESDEATVAELVMGFDEKYHKNRSLTKFVKDVIDHFGGQPFLTISALDELTKVEPKQWPSKFEEVISIEHQKENTHYDYALDALTSSSASRIASDALSVFDQLKSGEKNEQKYKISDSNRASDIKNLLVRAGLCKRLDRVSIEVKSIAHAQFYNDVWVKIARSKIATKNLPYYSHEYVQVDDGELPEVVVINAGGTLGMEFKDGKVVPPETEVSNPWYGQIGELAGIANIRLLPIFQPTDGVNINPPQWIQLADTIHRLRTRKIAGVVVMHGTDTLAYSASYLAYALGLSLNFPVIFTGSQAPHIVEFADAKINFLRALKAVVELSGKINEVGVCFGDEVYRAVRVEKKEDFRFAGFSSPSHQALAVIGEKVKIIGGDNQLRGRNWLGAQNLQAHCAERILKISLHPGLLCSMWLPALEVEKPPEGIVFECLGIGNVSTEAEFDLTPLLLAAGEMKIPVLISSRYPVQSEFAAQYEAASVPIKMGAITSRNMTPASALTKFYWAIGTTDAAIKNGDILEEDRLNQIKKVIETNLVGELDQEY